MKVRTSHQLSDILIDTVREEQPDLLILEWPHQVEALNKTSVNWLSEIPCDIAIVKGPIPVPPSRLLVPLRGGPYAELALRISLAIYHHQQCALTAMHLIPDAMTEQQDAPFRGLAMVLMNLPEVDRVEIRTHNPAQTILAESYGYDLVVMGVSAQLPEMQPALGGVVRHQFSNSPVGVIAVKSKRAMPVEIQSESVGQTAISVLVDKWFVENTYFADEFQDLNALLALKNQQKLTISLALPSLNEEETISTVIQTLKCHLMDQIPLLDEIVLVDSDSTDRTAPDCSRFGNTSIHTPADTSPIWLSNWKRRGLVEKYIRNQRRYYFMGGHGHCKYTSPFCVWIDGSSDQQPTGPIHQGFLSPSDSGWR